MLKAIIDNGAYVNGTDKNSTTALMIACQKANAGAINILLNAGADPMLSDINGATWIHHAVETGCSKEVLQAIIDHGADVNAANMQNWTALMTACAKSNADAINVLLKAGADPNIANVNGETCLYCAVRGACNREVLQVIIDHGADVNVKNENEITALMIACEKSNADSINILLNAGADTMLSDITGATWIHHAVGNDCRREVLYAIIDHGADVNATNVNNWTALMIACQKSNVDTINVLLKAGADPNIADVNGETCLYCAVRGACNKEVLQAIIDYGADVNATNMNNWTALMIACQKSNADVINVLLKAGADPNIADVNGETCLYDVVRGACNKEVLQGIIDHGADVNAANKNNITALMIACIKSNADAINILLKAGADPNIANANGETCLKYAVKASCNKEVLVAIIHHGTDVNATNQNNITALKTAFQKGNKYAIHALLNAGADPNIADSDGNTCLHDTVRGACNEDVLQAIIDHAADVNASNNKNWTPLMIACANSNSDAINVLLKAGADPNIADSDGYICLHVAVIRACNKEVIQIIIDHGADVNATDKNSITTLMIACQMANADAINILLNAGADPMLSDINGATWIHHAVETGCSKEVLQAIIDHGADVNAANMQNWTALMTACAKSNADAINVLLKAGADPNIANVNGETCLYCAVRGACNREVLQVIIDHGGDVNATNKNKETVLLKACRHRNIGAIKVLLNAGADPNIANDDGYTCLSYAVLYDCSKEMFQAIIDHFGDLNATNKNNETALLVAFGNGNKVAISVLLNAGADPNIANADGDTPLHYGVRRYGRHISHCLSSDVLQAVIDHGGDVNATNKNNETALLKACENGNEGAISVLLNAGADPNIANDDGDTSLHYGVRIYGKPKWHCLSSNVLQAIIDHGGDVNAINKNKETALLKACENENEGAISVLLNAGADPNIANTDGDTPLHCGVRRYLWLRPSCLSGDVLHTIIDHGGDVNATNKNKETALVKACENGNEGAISVLLNAGADPNIANDDGDTPLHYGVQRYWWLRFSYLSSDVLHTIIDHGGDVNATNKNKETALVKACENENEGAISVLLNAGADPNIANDDGDTFLHYGVQRNCRFRLSYLSSDVLHTIIDHGGDVNATNKNKETALVKACENGNEGAISVLLNAGADPNIANDDGDTSLHYGVQRNCRFRLSYLSSDVLHTIIDHGGDVNATNKNKETALVKACENGNEGAISVLLNAGADPSIANRYGYTCFLLCCSKQM